MNILGDAALAQVRELIRQEQGRVRGNRADHEPKLTKGPEMFVAYSSTGISAATQSLGVITPSSAICDLFEKDYATGELLPLYITGTTPNQREVFNFSTSAISAGYFPVWRDKRGTWWTMVAGEGEEQPGFQWQVTLAADEHIEMTNQNHWYNLPVPTLEQWNARTSFNASSAGEGWTTEPTPTPRWRCNVAGLWFVRVMANVGVREISKVQRLTIRHSVTGYTDPHSFTRHSPIWNGITLGYGEVLELSGLYRLTDGVFSSQVLWNTDDGVLTDYKSVIIRAAWLFHRVST